MDQQQFKQDLPFDKLQKQTFPKLGSGCGSVGRADAFDTRGPRFDSSHRQNFIEHLFIINCIEKTKINKKRPGLAHFKKKKNNYRQQYNYTLQLNSNADYLLDHHHGHSNYFYATNFSVVVKTVALKFICSNVRYGHLCSAVPNIGRGFLLLEVDAGYLTKFHSVCL